MNDSLRREIVRRLLTVTKPDRIILFGSAVAGKMTKDSDIDLLVVSPAPANTIDEHVALRRSLRGLGRPVDIFVIATEKFEESKNIFGGIAYPAHKYGCVIYEAADSFSQPMQMRTQELMEAGVRSEIHFGRRRRKSLL